jgi:hypothetical protein
MADWKQITARIRRARTGKDPAGQLANLFSKTRDAMVAFELARYFETSGNNADAGRWYLTAAERFRRADWKTKAQESATRLVAKKRRSKLRLQATRKLLLPRKKILRPGTWTRLNLQNHRNGRRTLSPIVPGADVAADETRIPRGANRNAQRPETPTV